MPVAKTSSGFPALASIVFLLLAVFGRWPYGFYTILRFVVCGSAIYIAVQAHAQDKSGWAWVMAVTAILFNPFVPVYLSRSHWQPIDFIAAVVFAISIAALRGRS
jgi:uncharacterized membrane protein